MPFNIGGPEAMFILLLVLIVFGAGRLPEVFGQIGKGIRTFRDESAGTATAAPTAAPTAASAPASGTCTKCRAALPPASKFCPNCGTAV